MMIIVTLFESLREFVSSIFKQIAARKIKNGVKFRGINERIRMRFVLEADSTRKMEKQRPEARFPAILFLSFDLLSSFVCVLRVCVVFFFVLSHSLSFFCRLSFLFFFLFFFLFLLLFWFHDRAYYRRFDFEKKKSAISKSHPSYFLVCSVCAGFPNTSWRTLWPRKLAWIFVAALCRSGSVRSIPSSSFMASFAWNNRLQRRRVDLLLQIGASLLRQYFARSMFVNGVKGLLHKRVKTLLLQIFATMSIYFQ